MRGRTSDPPTRLRTCRGISQRCLLLPAPYSIHELLNFISLSTAFIHTRAGCCVATAVSRQRQASAAAEPPPALRATGDQVQRTSEGPRSASHHWQTHIARTYSFPLFPFFFFVDSFHTSKFLILSFASFAFVRATMGACYSLRRSACSPSPPRCHLVAGERDRTAGQGGYHKGKPTAVSRLSHPVL